MYKEGLIQKGREQAMQKMINKSDMDAFMSMDPRIVELRRKMFYQDGVLLQEGPSGVQQGQLVPAPGIGQLQRYPVDDIVERTLCTLEMPFGRAGRKKSVAQAMALPPDSDALYDGRPILAEYARVEVAWMNTDFDQEEIDIPTDDGGRLLDSTLGSVVLWNKADIVLEMPTPSTQPSLPGSSPRGDDPNDGDDDDSGGKGNDNAGGPATSPRDSPPTNKSSARGDTGATPPSGSGSKEGSNQCPLLPWKPTDKEGATPLNHTKMSWEAYQSADKYPYSTEFERFAPFEHSHTL
jgi:hypothetical protein